MARRPRITEASVAKLGVEKLSALLVTEAASNKALKQALQLALESGQGVDSLAAGIRQRLISIGKSQSRLSTNKGREMLAELKRLQASITGDVADADPTEALSLMWQLVDLHRPLIERTRDRAGRLHEFFAACVSRLPDLAVGAKPDAERLAEDVYQRYMRDPYSLYEELIADMADALGDKGLAVLRERMETAHATHLKKTQRVRAQHARDHTLEDLKDGLRMIADAQGDVDAFIKTFSADEMRYPALGVEISVRLIGAGRAVEAITILEHAAPERDDPPEFHLAWYDTKLKALEKLGETDEVKTLSWAMFEAFMLPEYLRVHLVLLPDFDDIEAEERALDWVAGHEAIHPALMFLVAWPALPRAAKLVGERIGEIDGQYYELLLSAAEKLDGKFPLAGALIRRRLIEETLQLGRHHRFKQAKQHVRELEALDASITDYGDHEDHKAFMERLWLDHPHKPGFWSLLE